MRLFEQQIILGKEVYIFNIYEIHMAANEEITPVGARTVARAALYLCTPTCHSPSPALVTEPHSDGNCLSPKDEGLQTVLDVKESRQARTLETLPKREVFHDKDRQFFSLKNRTIVWLATWCSHFARATPSSTACMVTSCSRD